MKKINILILLLCIMLAASVFAACGDKDMIPLPDGGSTESDSSALQSTAVQDTAVQDGITDIDLSAIEGDSDGYYSITSPGTYRLFSQCSVGIRIEVKKTESVDLILDGADILNEKGAAIYIASADSVTVTLNEGSENYLADGRDYVTSRGDEPNACLFSKDDLTITGNGALNVHGQCNNGIGTKNCLEILSGNITVTAAKNALKGNDGVTVTGGKIEIPGCKDGIKSDPLSESGGGYVSILGGDISIKCADDGVQGGNVTIRNCRITVDAGDKQINCDGNIDIADGCLG